MAVNQSIKSFLFKSTEKRLNSVKERTLSLSPKSTKRTWPFPLQMVGEAWFSSRVVTHFAQPPAAARCKGVTPPAAARSSSVSGRLVRRRASSCRLRRRGLRVGIRVCRYQIIGCLAMRPRVSYCIMEPKDALSQAEYTLMLNFDRRFLAAPCCPLQSTNPASKVVFSSITVWSIQTIRPLVFFISRFLISDRDAAGSAAIGGAVFCKCDSPSTNTNKSIN